MNKLFTLFLIFFCSFSSICKEKTFDYSWLEYDIKSKKVHHVNNPAKNKSYNLLLKNYKKRYLQITPIKGMSVYVDGHFYRSFYNNEKDSLDLFREKSQGYYRNNLRLITFYHDKKIASYNQIIDLEVSDIKSSSTEEYKSRKKNHLYNFIWIIVSALLLFIYIIKKNYIISFNFLFRDYLNVFFKQNSIDKVTNNSFSIFVISSICISVLFSITLLLYGEDNLLFNPSLRIFYHIIIVLLFLSIKAIVTYLVAFFYDLDIYKRLIISYSKLLLTGFLIIVIFSLLTDRMVVLDSKYIVFTMVLILFIITLNQVWHIVDYNRFRKLYLFSYLCTSELIPLLFSIKLLDQF